jgi:hypothetical protein
MYRFYFCAVLIFSIHSIRGQSISYGPVINVASGQGNYWPRITINGHGQPVVLWGRHMPYLNLVSVGNGMGFTPAIQVHPTYSVWPSASQWWGSNIAAAGNTIWVALRDGQYDGRIYVLRSNDGGFTWGDTIRVDPEDSLIKQLPSITVQDPDEPIVQYIEINSDLSERRQVVSRMTNGSFSSPIQVSLPFAPGNVCGSTQGQLVSNGDHVVALFGNSGNDESAVWGAFSADGGESFLFGSQMDTTGSSGCATGPDGIISGDSITYVWTSVAEDGQLIHIGRTGMLDGGIGYHALMLPGSGAVGQYYPRIAGSGDTLGVVWRHHAAGDMNVLFSWSVTGLSGFSIPDTVNIELGGLQREPDIAYADGAFHIVWRDSGLADVRYRKATLNSNVGMENIANYDHHFLVWPNPTNGLLHLGNKDWERADIIDMSGRIVFHEKGPCSAIDLSRLASGSYMIVLYDRNENSHRARFEKQ